MSHSDDTTKSSEATERSLAARAAAHTSWAQTDDWSARTRRARERFLERFEDQVDPERTLLPAERARRAEAARRGYFTTLALRSARARRRAAAASEQDALRDELRTALTSLITQPDEEVDQ